MGKKKEQPDGPTSERLVVRIKRSFAVLAQPVETEAHATSATRELGRDERRADGALQAKDPRNQALDLTDVMRTLATVATALWRIRSKLTSESLPELPHELRHLPRHVQAAWDALESCHVQVKDHKDERYSPGMAVNPITFQPTQGVATEIICETIKPSVFYHDILIQRADVIVAQPLDNTDSQIEPGPESLERNDDPCGRAKEN